MTPAEWYRQNYPDAPEHDDRCLAVLASWQALYNIPRTGRARTDGGFRQCGKGVSVHVPPGHGTFATYDFAELTRLVIAAHRHCCRVEIGHRGHHLIVRVHPRKPAGTHQFERHPSLADLIAAAS